MAATGWVGPGTGWGARVVLRTGRASLTGADRAGAGARGGQRPGGPGRDGAHVRGGGAGCAPAPTEPVRGVYGLLRDGWAAGVHRARRTTTVSRGCARQGRSPGRVL